MEARELMIGDWYRWYADGKYYLYQVKSEDFLKDHVVNFEPIPLTAEILEKNGFICLDDGGIQYEWYSWALKGTDFSFNFYGDCGEIDIANCIIEFKYVHELQHVLKLCGLNELADNLKVE